MKDYKGMPRRAFIDLQSQAEGKLRNTIEELEKLGASPKITNLVTQTIALQREVADYIDDKGEFGHDWTFDDQRGGVHCSKCGQQKHLWKDTWCTEVKVAA